MSFYQSISKYYDNIFPTNPIQADFVYSLTESSVKEKNILDIGCGTGNLTELLYKNFKQVTGIDLDNEMLSIAKSKNTSQNILYKETNMLSLTEDFNKDSFDIVSCFGNTLVHLNSTDEISSFFENTKAILKPNGKLLIQIINYDRILDNSINHLPTIEKNDTKFERLYSYNNATNRISFKTILTDKTTDNKIINEINLIPLRKEEITDLLVKSGFSNIEFYGSFKRDKLTSESIPLIISSEL